MGVLKSFRVQIVSDTTPNATVLYDLGPCVLPILEWERTVQQQSEVPADFFESYTSEYQQVGGPILYGNPDDDDRADWYAKFLLIAPLSVDRGLYPYRNVNGYVRFLSNSGYYAVSDKTLSKGTLNINKLYDRNGTLVSEYAIYHATTTQYGSCACEFFLGVTQNDIIQDVKQSVTVRDPYRLTKIQFDVQPNNVSASAQFLAWLNGCTTYKEYEPQTITVSWARPGDGKVLTDTYDIDVAPPSATGGNTGGNTGGGGTEEGGGGGGHAF